jgi:hypothetical protein
MSKRSQAWKALEREAARLLGGKRVVRGDWGESDVDVKTEFPQLKVDCKYRQSHAHHALLKTIDKKYCVPKGGTPVLVTKHKGQPGCNVTITGQTFATLLDCLRVTNRLCRSDVMLFADIAREVTANSEDLEEGIRGLTMGEKHD